MKISAIGLSVKLDKSLTKIAWPRRNSTRKGEKGLCLYSTDITLIAQSNSFLTIFYTEVHFTVSGKNVALALYRRLQFHGPLAISSKPGVLRGKHFHTIMETIQEHIMVERERLKKGSLD